MESFISRQEKEEDLAKLERRKEKRKKKCKNDTAGKSSIYKLNIK
jgi:hypothetical protein